MASASVLVDKATSDLLIGPDWGMNLEICDLINRDPMQSRDVIKAVKKRLGSKNPKVQLLALMLLETLVKNCGMIVHQQVAEKDVLHEMVKIVKRKTDMDVRDKILVLLDSWQEAFGGPGGRFPQFYMAYDELRRMGVDFPDRAPENAAPIFTPPQTHPVTTYHAPGYMLPGPRVDESVHLDTSTMSLEDIKVARAALEVLSEMLNAINTGDRQALKDDIIVELVSQSRTSQQRVQNLVNVTTEEELLRQGLALNDELQRVLAKHDAIASGAPLPLEQTVPAAQDLSHRYDENDEEEDKFSQLAHRSSKLRASTQPQGKTNVGNEQLSHSNGLLALPPPPQPIKKLNPPPSQRVSPVDLLSTLDNNYKDKSPRSPLTPPPWGDSSAGALVPYEPFQEDETNPFASSPPFKATPLSEPVHALVPQPIPQQHYAQSSENSGLSFQSSTLPVTDQLAQTSYVASWSVHGRNQLVPQQNIPVYSSDVQNLSPPPSTSYLNPSWADNSHMLHSQQNTSPALSMNGAAPRLPPPPGLYNQRQQFFQQQDRSQQTNLQSPSAGLRDPTGHVHTSLDHSNSLYGQANMKTPLPPVAKKNSTSSFTTSDKLFDDLVDLHGLTDKLKTAGISNRLSRANIGRT